MEAPQGTLGPRIPQRPLSCIRTTSRIAGECLVLSWSKTVENEVPHWGKSGDDEAEWLFAEPSPILSPVWAYVWARSPVRHVTVLLLTTLFHT